MLLKDYLKHLISFIKQHNLIKLQSFFSFLRFNIAQLD